MDNIEPVADGGGQEDALARSERERAEYLDGWKRVKAELSNYKKEETERMEAFVKFSNQALIHELVSILDSFDLGLTTFREGDPAKNGMQQIRVQLEDVMRRFGLEQIPVTIGEAFNPARHEAIGEIDSDVPPHAIAREVSKGYALHAKVIRPARVMLAKSPPMESQYSP